MKSSYGWALVGVLGLQLFLLVNDEPSLVFRLLPVVAVLFVCSLGGLFVKKPLFSLLAGATLLLLLGFAKSTLHCGYEIEKLRMVEGKVIYDSSVSSSGNTTLTLQLQEAYLANGDKANATGEVTVLCKECPFYVAGTVIEAQGTFIDHQYFVATKVSQIQPLRWYENLRSRVLMFLRHRFAGFSAEAGYLAKAIAFGIVQENSILRSLSVQSGSAHVLSLSGMHVGVVAAAVGVLTTKGKKRLIAPVCTFGYVLVVGFKPSVVRALLLLTLRSLFPTLSLEIVLFISYVIQLCVFPFTATSLAALLSYGSLSVLLLFSLPIAQQLSLVMPTKLSLTLGASLAVVGGSAPLSLVVFGQWYPVGIGLSVGIVPLAMTLLLCSLAYAVMPLTFIQALIELLAQWYYGCVKWGALHSFGQSWSDFFLFLASVLTAMVFVEYASRAAKEKQRRNYHVGFSLRFTKSDSTPS